MNKSDIQQWWQLCQQAIANADWPVAEGTLRRLLDLQPGKPELLDLLGYALLMQGEFQSCESVLREAMACGSRSFWTPHKLGDALRGLQLLEEAQQAYEQALSWGSDSPLTSRNLLQVLDALEPGRATARLQQWAQGSLDWNQRTAWLQGACEAALASPGLELATWLQQHGCPDPEIRRLGVEQALLRLDFNGVIERAHPALRERLERMLMAQGSEELRASPMQQQRAQTLLHDGGQSLR